MQYISATFTDIITLIDWRKGGVYCRKPAVTVFGCLQREIAHGIYFSFLEKGVNVVKNVKNREYN
jgi:hypothetical protein